MYLTPREQEALLIFVAADLARKRRERGLKLNYPEAVALISEAMIEAARDGRSVTEAAEAGARVLDYEEVMDGVSQLIDVVQIEATFPDGTKLVSCHNPIQEASMDSTGYYIVGDGDIELNAGRRRLDLVVANTGDRPVQVGSHAHFFEVNRYLRFDRRSAFGMRLDIPAGTAVRFEPGDRKPVTLVELGGARTPGGMLGLTDAAFDAPGALDRAVERALALGFDLEAGP